MMQKILFFSLLFLLLQNGFAQSEPDTGIVAVWKESILKDTNLSATENLEDVMDLDLYDLLKTDATDQPLGFIGDDYERFEIFYTSVKKDPSNKNEYIVTGKNRVKTNICDFKGTLTLTHARYYIHKSDLGNYPDSVKVGVLTGTYHFSEDKKQKHVGTLQGYFAVKFFMQSSGKIFIDDWNNGDNKYYNNQYVGTWKSYDGKMIQPCHWGNFRIPVSGDLDTGKKDFMPNEKYKGNGWEKYPSLLNTIWWK